MANKKITELQLIAALTDDVNFPGDDTLQTYRITAGQFKTYLKWGIGVTVQRFTTGSGTYTTPAGVKRIRVRMVGGGGGGGGGANPSSATAGGDTTFGTSLLIATGGTGGSNATSSAYGGPGGSPTVNSPAILIQATLGGTGSPGQPATSGGISGLGGATPLGPGGSGAVGAVGETAVLNCGGGGGGGSTSASVNSGHGGGGGAFVEAEIVNPLATYSYVVGDGGANAAGGTNGYAGGNGSAGIIIVEEYYS